MQFHLENAETLSRFLNKTITVLLEGEPLDSLEYYYKRSQGYIVAVIHNSAFQSLNQQGLLPNIKEDSLRSELPKYFNFVQPNVVEFREFD